MRLTVDAASLHTGISKRDKHLRAAAFFDTHNHPEVRFRSTSVRNTPDHRLRAEGELEVAGERVQLQLEPTIEQTDDQRDIEATTTVDNPNHLTVHVRLRRESSAPRRSPSPRPR